MDSCVLSVDFLHLYNEKEFTKDCIFNEIFEQHHYNTYTSARYSDGRRTLYVALNKRGLPRKVQVRAGAPLRRLATYAQTLIKPAPQAAVDRLLAAAAAAADPQPTAHPLRHHAHQQLCPVSRAPATTPDDAPADGDADGRDKTRCRRRRKRKKRKRRCREGEPEGEDCQGQGERPRPQAKPRRPAKARRPRRCKDAPDRDQCRRQRQRQRRRGRDRDRRRHRGRAAQPAADPSFKDRTNQRDLEGSGSAEPAERLTAEAEAEAGAAATAAAEATTARPQ